MAKALRRVMIGVATLLIGFDIAVGAATTLVLRPRVGTPPARADAVVVFSDDPARVKRALELIAERRSSVLVVSRGSIAYLGVAERCGTTEPFELLCPDPQTGDTKGEAELFGRLAAERRWTSLIAVTSIDHVTRARVLLARCFAGRLSFVGAKPYRTLGEALRHELGGLLDATFDRGC